MSLASDSSSSPGVRVSLIILASGLLVLWTGWRVYTGKWRRLVIEGQWAGPMFTGFALAWLGPGISLVGLGMLIDAATGARWLERVAGALAAAGFLLWALAGVFMFYLPKRLRPAGFTSTGGRSGRSLSGRSGHGG
jgi:hypothetical protein